MEIAERKQLSKKIRFEVFKRDKFTCQYCGRSAPDVVLEVDHMIPVANGGSNDIMNLITSCKDCNRGKGARALSDDSIIKKQQAQIQELAERKEQLEMMLEWRNGLSDLKSFEVSKICDYFAYKSKKCFCVKEYGRRKIEKWLSEFSITEIMDAMDVAFDAYFSGTQESAKQTFDKISGICNNRKHGQSRQSYWYNYLRKACISKYRLDFADYLDELKEICFSCMKTEDDFVKAKFILFREDDGYFFMSMLRKELL